MPLLFSSYVASIIRSGCLSIVPGLSLVRVAVSRLQAVVLFFRSPYYSIGLYPIALINNCNRLLLNLEMAPISGLPALFPLLLSFTVCSLFSALPL